MPVLFFRLFSACLFCFILTLPVLSISATAFAQAASERDPQNPFRLFFTDNEDSNAQNNPAQSGAPAIAPQAAPQAYENSNSDALTTSSTQQNPEAQFRNSISTKVNQNVLGLISGTPNGTYISIAADIAQVLDDGDKMRIIPLVGKGGAQNIRDLIFLRGVDMAIVQSDAREVFARDDDFRPLLSNLRYITKLYNEELHIFARDNITSLRDLDGKRVNISDLGSGTNVTMRRVFEQLRINPQIENMGQLDAYEAMRNGELDATILIAGKPSGAFSRFEALSGFSLLPLTLADINSNHFVPSVLRHEDYPNLIATGETIDTVAVEAILVAYDWPVGHDRRRRLYQFIEKFVENIDAFRQAPRHPKWQETNIAADVPLWTRFKKVDELLAEMRQQGNAQDASSSDALREEFETYLNDSGQAGNAAQVDEAARQELFQDFLIWKNAQ
jgi:TRAP transporter TAXI family solute receptor